MDFSLFLSCYYPDTSVSPRQHYADAVAHAKLAEDAGFCGISIPEHHFINLLMVPSPLMLAVKVASVTAHLPITTSVLVLPFYDMKRLAGEIALADCLTDGRLHLGVGRGAFAYEFERFGLPVGDSRERFDDSLAVLEALLSGEEVSWDSDAYRFAPLTIMPRPLQSPPPIWIAALTPTAIYHCARRGYHVQATPLKPSPGLRGQTEARQGRSGESIPFGDAGDLIKGQIDAFYKGVAEAGTAASGQRYSLLRVAYVTRDDADTRDKARMARDYYRRFSTMRESTGDVRRGVIEMADIADSEDDVAGSLLVGTADQVVERLKFYEDLGIPEMTLNMHIGAGGAETLAAIERFASDVMPHFKAPNDRRLRSS